MTAMQSCALCTENGGALVFQGKKFRAIRAEEAGFPAFYRVVWTDHVAEFSDLGPADRTLCMSVVCAVEKAVRTQLQPTKVNLATLGNVVPHLHWHVIARFDWDSHFPAPVWAEGKKPVDELAVARVVERRAELEQAIRVSLSALERGA